MNVLMASTPATGHLNPVLGVARDLLSAGHEVTVLSGSTLRSRIEAAGAAFRAFPAAADLDLTDIVSIVPELRTMAPGPEQGRLTGRRVFVDPIPAQYEGLQQAIHECRPDVIVGDNTIFGVLPLLLGPRAARPPVVLCGTSFLHLPRNDGAPHFLGLWPATTQEQRDRYAVLAEERARAISEPIRHHLNETLASLGVGPLPMQLFSSSVMLADAYLQLSVPSFEFPCEVSPNAHFVGTPSIVPNQAPLPSWASDVDGPRKVVLVTQGTVANHDFGLLVRPTLDALAEERDVLVVVTTGGRPIVSIPGTIPSNARVARYLPFEWALAKASVFVTNGGYGSVTQALSYGLPIVGAGTTQDKADVNARIAWTGAGIDLRTNEPTPQAIREAVRTVLDQPTYRVRAKAMADEFAKHDTRSEVLHIIGGLVHGT
ncbi:MAG: nucleotide disphospho-sugar-binding domain-containing protein, partial [Bradyrhizobium sp.]